MIQRIQTFWLLAAAICTALSFRFSFYSGNKAGADGQPSFEKLTASSHFLLLLIAVLLIAGSMVIIFLYKNRKQQFWLTIAASFFAILNIVLYVVQTNKFLPQEGNYDLTSILVLLIPVFYILAARAVRKDEKLMKSLDRLR
jgi:preprotein translocase subunit YajC